MAKVNACRICGTSVINRDCHPECEHADLMDLIFEAQECLRQGGPIPDHLVKRIMNTKAEPLADFKMRLHDDQRRRVAGELRQTALAKCLREAAEEFDRKFPDPNPPRY